MNTIPLSLRPFLLALLLVTIGLRSVLGAPCCVSIAEANKAHETHIAGGAQHDGHAHSAHADHQSHTGHQGHGDNPSANPCCSACGPTLPPEPTIIGAIAAVAEAPVADPIRELETRPPFPAYEARGPPPLI